MDNANEIKRLLAYFGGAYFSAVILWIAVLLLRVYISGRYISFDDMVLHAFPLAAPIAIVATFCHRACIGKFVSAFLAATLIATVFGFWSSMFNPIVADFNTAALSFMLLFNVTFFIAYPASWIAVLTAYLFYGPDYRNWHW